MASEFEQALKVLADADARISPRIVNLLSTPTREEERAFAACWRELSVARRQEAIATMVAAAERSFELDFVALFRHCLNDEDPLVRRQAIEGLWEDERADLADRLMLMLRRDPDSGVRAAAALSAGRFVLLAECDELDEKRAKALRAALEEAADDPLEDLDVVRRAVEALAYINDGRVRALIERTYEHGDQRLRESAVFAMGRSADAFWADIVLAELLSPSPAMRYEAARACGEMQLRRAVEPLINLADDPDREVQGMAIWALGQIGGTRARRALERWAAGDDAELVSAAVEALDELEFSARPLDLFVHDPAQAELSEVVFDDVGDDDDLDDDSGDDWEDEALSLDI